MRLPTEAETLQASAIIVAAPRYCGAFASAIGIDILSYWHGFAHIEIASGAAMAILEGWAIAFMFRKWATMDSNSIRWKVLLLLQLVLMVMLPMVATPYLVSSQLAQPINQIMGIDLMWIWSFIVAAVAPLILAAVGYADVPNYNVESKPVLQKQPEIKIEKPVIKETKIKPKLTERQSQIVNMLDNKSVTGIAKELEISAPTVYKELNQLAEMGITHKNGNGWEVA